MNAKELSELSGLHENTIRNMIKRGDLKAEKKGRFYEIDPLEAEGIILGRKYLSKKQDAISDTHYIVQQLELEKKEIFKTVISMFARNDFSYKLLEISSAISEDKTTDSDIDCLVDNLYEYCADTVNFSHVLELFNEYKNIVNSMEYLKLVQKKIISKNNQEIEHFFIENKEVIKEVIIEETDKDNKRKLLLHGLKEATSRIKNRREHEEYEK